MRVVFAGSPDVARTVLEACVGSGMPIVGVISQPDRPVGRKKVVTPTPVSAYATANGMALECPESSEELAAAIERLQPDLVIAVAYGRLITSDVLALPTHGWWNLHFSLLPAYRGATPVQHALLQGEVTTGVSVFQIDEGLDTGRILAQEAVIIRPLITAGELVVELAGIGAPLLIRTFHDFLAGHVEGTPQSGGVSLAPKLPRDAGLLDCSLPVAEVFRRFQATTPEPGAYLMLGEGAHQVGARLGVRDARPLPEVRCEPGVVDRIDDRVVVGCHDGALELREVQPAGKKAMTGEDWWRGVGRPVHCG